MILAYPYFERDHLIYYVYKYNKETGEIHILSYNPIEDMFVAILKRTVASNGKLTLDYRPKRITVHIDEMYEVEE